MMKSLEQLVQDVRFGARNLARSPGFALLAIASLAIGIMGTTSIYSVLYGVVLDPFPYKDVDRLMSVRVSNAAMRGYRTGYSVDQFLEIAERNRIFDGVIASTISDVVWTGDGDPLRLRGNYGTFNTFDVMGVPPLLGRTPMRDDALAGAAPVVVLGYRFWQRQFSGDANVLGRQLRLNGITRTVIGVMPKRFMWRGADVYLPTTFARGRTIEGVRSVHLLGRLKAGVSDAQAEADLKPIIADLKTREPSQFPEQWRVGLLSFAETFPSGIRRDVWVLFGAVALLLLIACANVSNLLLSRVTARSREMTVRAALGAGRRRLVRQMLTESLLLAIAGAAVGTALAYGGLPALLALVPPDMIPDESEITVNGQVVAFTFAVCALTSVLCGIAPALQSAGTDIASALREASRSVAGNRRFGFLRNALVIFEVALALVLLSGSSLLIRTFLAMQRVDFGFPADRVLTLRVPLSTERYPDAARRIAFFQELLPRIAALPGVTAAGLNTGIHPLGNMWTTAQVAGLAPNQDPVQVHQIGGGYIAALGIRLASGRLFTDQELISAQPIALVNERFVRTRLEDRPPLGQVVRLPRLAQAPFSATNDSFTIAGVVHDVPNEGLREPTLPEIYVPFATTGVANLLAVRTAVDPSSLTRSIMREVYSIDRDQPVHDVKPLDVVLRDWEYATPRFNLLLVSVFATLGLALALVGVYGVMATAVAQQRHELGVRLALGAGRGAIARMVLVRGSKLLAGGLTLGLAVSLVIARMLARQVWNVSPFDPVAFVLVAAILIVAGLQACLLPALRAARTDPIIALRME
jgi:putative ABC transport system permease protein